MRELGRIFGLAVCAATALAAGVPAPARAAPAAASAASPWAANPQSRVRLISAWRVAPRHGELRLGLQFRLAPGWHVYWKNSGDAGFAPVVAFARQPGLAPPELLWPAPHRYELPGGLLAFGYAGEVVYPVKTAIDAPAGSERLHLAADVDYVVCAIECVPYRYTLNLDQALGERPEVDAANAALLERWWRELPLAADRQPGVQADAEIVGTGAAAADLRFELRLRGVTAQPGGADLFFETQPALELGRPRSLPTAEGLVFEVPARRQDSSAALPAGIEIAWTATGLRQDGGPLALAARQLVPIHRAAPGAANAAARGLHGALAAGDPRLVALAAVAAAFLALERWGLLTRRRDAGDGQGSPAVPQDSSRREALGFLALLLTLGSLYALSLEIGAEGLAGVEAALLAMALLAWLRQRTGRQGPRRLARALLAGALAACAIAPPWLAGHSRLASAGRPSPPYHGVTPAVPAPGRAPS
jgi:DsbC/DsbD-like thiol-disulfide interchange protein